MTQQNNITTSLPLDKTHVREGLIGVAIIVTINILFFNDHLGFLDVSPHPFWIVVLPIATRYGFKAGFLTGLIAAITLIAMLKLNRPDLDIFDIVHTGYCVTPLLFVLAGIIIGEISEAQRKMFKELKDSFNNLYEMYQNLSKRYEAINTAKQELDARIITQEHTISSLFKKAQNFKSLSENEIYPSALALLKDSIFAEASSIYLLSDNKLKLIASSHIQKEKEPLKEISSSEGIMGDVISSGETISINTMITSDEFTADNNAEIIISAPIFNSKDNILGVLNVEKLPFVKFNPQAVRITSLIADWCGDALENSRAVATKIKDNISNDLTGAYTYDYLNKRFPKEFNRALRFQIPLSVIILEICNFLSFSNDIQENILSIFKSISKKQLRDIDLLFQYKNRSQYILLLPNTAFEGAMDVKRRIILEINVFKFKPYEKSNDLLRFTVGAAEINEKMKKPEELIQKALKNIV